MAAALQRKHACRRRQGSRGVAAVCALATTCLTAASLRQAFVPSRLPAAARSASGSAAARWPGGPCHHRLRQALLTWRAASLDDLGLDGLDDLEEEAANEEDNPEDLDTYLQSLKPGEATARLRELYNNYTATGEEPELDEKERMKLYTGLEVEARQCEEGLHAAWVVHALEEMELDDDGVYQAYSNIIQDHSHELDAQWTHNSVVSFGKLYWMEPDLTDPLAQSVRRHLKDFTMEEIIRIATAFERIGVLTTTRHAGLLFEMQERVNLPKIQEFIASKVNQDVNVYREDREGLLKFLDSLDDIPNKKFEAHIRNYLLEEISDAKTFQRQNVKMKQYEQKQRLLGFQAMVNKHQLGEAAGNVGIGMHEDPEEAAKMHKLMKEAFKEQGLIDDDADVYAQQEAARKEQARSAAERQDKAAKEIMAMARERLKREREEAERQEAEQQSS